MGLGLTHLGRRAVLASIVTCVVTCSAAPAERQGVVRTAEVTDEQLADVRAAAGDGDEPLSRDCLDGSGASRDPLRSQACRMLYFANADRAAFAAESGGAAPLVWDERLWDVADAHSRDMCERGYFGHDSPGYGDPFERMQRSGIAFRCTSENLAAGVEVRSSHYAFMAEPTCVGHRANLLSPRSSAVGISVYACSSGPHADMVLITQTFAGTSSCGNAWDYCDDDQRACQLPPAPVSTVSCPPALADGGMCDPPRNADLRAWGCR